ncbi:hypothetical protein GCM10023149_31510 [Mucilaginibacter gynuensis]|uniref:Phage protein n=1 Tax=Mucilaginibacter gynuensis TaxID=1302236 RepID=A0ABP8GPM6_9SPHI
MIFEELKTTIKGPKGFKRVIHIKAQQEVAEEYRPDDKPHVFKLHDVQPGLNGEPVFVGVMAFDEAISEWTYTGAELKKEVEQQIADAIKSNCTAGD